MPARLEELHHAKEEGIELHVLCNPTKILDDGNGRVGAMECVRMELGEPDASGRRRPVAIEGSEFQLAVDTVIMALGTSRTPSSAPRRRASRRTRRAASLSTRTT